MVTPGVFLLIRPASGLLLGCRWLQGESLSSDGFCVLETGGQESAWLSLTAHGGGQPLPAPGALSTGAFSDRAPATRRSRTLFLGWATSTEGSPVVLAVHTHLKAFFSEKIRSSQGSEIPLISPRPTLFPFPGIVLFVQNRY